MTNSFFFLGGKMKSHMGQDPVSVVDVITLLIGFFTLQKGLYGEADSHHDENPSVWPKIQLLCQMCCIKL
jgi:hypothetical protein